MVWVLRQVTAIALLPLCWGLSVALVQFVLRSLPQSELWVALLGGLAAGWITFALLPKPMRLYVLGHELTHALWAWAFGGSVRSFKVGAAGGQVVVTKSNSLIVLAPYFFPLYTILWAVGCALFRWLVPGRLNLAWVHAGIGLTYAFHLALTIAILRVRQPDIEQESRFFSASLIWLGNVAVLLCLLPALVSGSNPLVELGRGWEETGRWLDLLVRSLGL